MMKKLRINEGSVALVFKNEVFKRVITQGDHWLAWGETAKVYDINMPFCPTVSLDILLKDQRLKEMLSIVDVKDDQIVLNYENERFREVLPSGRYAYWKGGILRRFTFVDLSKVEITEEIAISTLRRADLYQYIRLFVVEPYERALLFVDGKYIKELETGTHYYWKNAATVLVQKIDTRQLRMEISGQEILTGDKAAIRVNFELMYKVVDIHKALIDNKEYEKQLYVTMQMALREYLGTISLDELLENKTAINSALMQITKNKALVLGIELRDCGIKDIILPGEIKDIMNKVLVAQKQAQANVIMRREETASTRSLLNTAKLMEDNTMLYKLKEMEYVEKIAEKINNITLSGGSQVVDQLRQIFT